MSLKVVLGEAGAKIQIGEKEFQLSPLTLRDIADAEEKFGVDLEGFEGALKKVKNLLFLVYLSLKKKHPEVKIEDVGDMFQVSDMGKLEKLFSSILNLSGMVQEKNDQGTVAE